MKLFSQVFCGLIAVALSGSFVMAHDDMEDAKGIDGVSGAVSSSSGGGSNWARSRVRLRGHLFLDEMGSLGASNVLGNDIWGWTDSASGREFALFGMTNQTAFVEVTNPDAPTYLGSLATETGNRAWRDVKVYNDQAYIVSDLNGAHGMQVFDLTQLLTATQSSTSSPTQFSTVGVYNGVDRAHNIFINEDSGFGYIVGTPSQGAGGLHIVDLNGGTGGAMPTFVANFGADGYTHDTQVVNYVGPDTAYAGREIAFSSNEDTLTIVDVTDKTAMNQLSRSGYAGSEYSHQGWLSEDHKYFFMNDELDEDRSDTLINTRTFVWDVSDLDNPFLVGTHEGEEATIDHNLYVKGDYIFQANYSSGLRILKINDAASMDIEEHGFIDTHPDDNLVNFDGAWSVFPYFNSGTVIVSDRQSGLFIINVIPEPSSMAILGLGALAVFSRRRRV